MSDFWGAAATPPVPGSTPPPPAAFAAVAPPSAEQPAVPSHWRPGMAVAAPGPQYGAPLEALHGTGQTRRIVHRPWSTVLLVFHVLQLVAGVVVTGGAAFAIAAMTGTGDAGGFGGMLAVLGLVVGAVLLGISVVLLLLTTKGRRRADEGRPGMLFATGVVATVLGALSLLGLMGGGEPVNVSINLVLSGLYTFAGVRTFLAARG